MRSGLKDELVDAVPFFRCTVAVVYRVNPEFTFVNMEKISLMMKKSLSKNSITNW